VALDDTLSAVPELDLDVIFEDQWLLVLNKPAGLPTQGTQASDRHDVLALVTRKRPDAKLILYPDAGHGFNADYRDTYSEKDAKEGWSRMLAWFKANGVS